MQTKTQKHRLPNESETSWKHTPNAKTAKKNDVCTVPGSFAFLYSSSVYTSQFVNSSCALGSFSDSESPEYFISKVTVVK